MKEVNVFDILLEDEQSKLNVQNREQIINNDIKLKEEKRFVGLYIDKIEII